MSDALAEASSSPQPAGGPPLFAVLGAGSWGTALALQLARVNAQCLLWSWEQDHVDDMSAHRENRQFLPGVAFPDVLRLESSVERAVVEADEVLIAVPSHAFVPVLKSMAPFLAPNQGVAWASKGLEPGSGELLHVCAERILSGEHPLAVLTGPSFATEVSQDLPTAVTVAGTEPGFCRTVAQAFHGGNFRAYTSDDIVGAELGGAVKNVLAVATGISDGMGLGNNARAALITRGLAEMMRLGKSMGAQQQTLMGLAGMGDLVLTCTGDLSRNRRLGLALGRGSSVEDAVREIGQVVEGVQTSAEVWRLARRCGVEMPIAEQVYGIIHQGHDPYQCVRNLLSREQKHETH